VLIKENHIQASGSIKKAIEGVKKVAPHGCKIEIEVTSMDELKQAIQAHADIIMLDNFSPDQVKTAVKLIQSKFSEKDVHGKPCLEVSGGIQLETVQDYVMPGV